MVLVTDLGMGYEGNIYNITKLFIPQVAKISWGEVGDLDLFSKKISKTALGVFNQLFL